MSQIPFRCQVRLTLSDLDRSIYTQRTVVVAQYPDEPDEHILLRFLTHVLFYDERLQDAQGWIDGHEPDLWATDLTGRLTLWVEAGLPPMKRLIKAMTHQKGARFVALFGDRAEAEAFRTAIVAERPRNIDQLEIHVVPAPFLAFLEQVGGRNMAWTATLTEGTLYLESDGHAGQCVLEQIAVLQHGGDQSSSRR